MAERYDTYGAVRPVPYLLERGRAQTIACPIRYGSTGALVAPTSGTITVTRPDGTSLVSAAAVTVTSSVAEYALAAPAATETLGEGWTVEWTLTFTATVYPVYRFDAYLCEYVPHCPISAADLYRYEPELAARIPQSQSSRGDNTGWQPQIDDAYYAFIQHLIDAGHRPWLIRGMTGAREWIRTEALMRACRALATADDSVWFQKATDYRYEHRAADAALVVQFSNDDPGVRRGTSNRIRLAPVRRPTC
jgi:hypothetical protein